MTIPSTRIPISTYRFQFNHRFTFQDAAEVIPYLHDLGITDCYASPYFKAVEGSLHGYDVVDPTSLNGEIGSEADFQIFVQALKSHNMGQILDVVPNHLGIARSSNPWWQDVLENGPSSHYAHVFDIDWAPVKPELENKVLLPILGDQYGVVLENQEIILRLEDGQFFLRYYEHHFPLDPGTWILILTFRLEEFIEEVGEHDPNLQEFQSIVTALTHLPVRSECDLQRVTERYREKEVIRRRLATLHDASTEIAGFLKENIRILNGVKGSHRSFDLLDALVSNQAYRLAYWRVAAEEINYRRFFDINELAAVRAEQPGVFQEIHPLVFELVRSGAVTGLRIDHVDGLYDPRNYLRLWQTWACEELGIPLDQRGRSLFIVVEKILGKGETLAEDWPIHGTTGYDFLNLVNNLFVDAANQQALDKIYSRFIKDDIRFEDLVYESKKLIMAIALSSEINTLGHQINLLSERNRRSRDFTLNSLIHAVSEIIACFPVYRTYVTPEPSEGVTDRDRAYIRLAVARAMRKNPALSSLVFDFIRELLLKLPSDGLHLDWEDSSPFVMKFQQTTSPVTAKGVEDTALYVYNRLISLNEVGGEPDRFGISPGAFHQRMSERASQWPYGLSTISTHDTKRGEDVRARINVLSEIPKEWGRCVSRWNRINKKAKQFIEEQPVPDRNEEFLLYQTLIGAWPFEDLDDQGYSAFCDRIQGYMNKALKEAKVHSSWINPDETYESAVRDFIAKILRRTPSNAFLADFVPFQKKVSQFGIYNSLAQVLIKITAPGLPDFYQGSELWDLRLVDPDNRQPVDYILRRRLLSEIRAHTTGRGRSGFLKTLLDSPFDGRIKLFVIMTALEFRNRHSSLFLDGDYQGLEPQGNQSRNLCAFARIRGDKLVMTIVPRLITNLIPEPSILPFGKNIWSDTRVPVPTNKPESRFRNIFTGEIMQSSSEDRVQSLPLENIFQNFPVALLEHLP